MSCAEIVDPVASRARYAARPVRLAVVVTHPIQYHVPVFQVLTRSQHMKLRVFYTWSQTARGAIADSGFGQLVTWDIPLLEGYEFEFVPNVARRPGPEHFFGLRTPGLNHAVRAWQPDAVLIYGWYSAAHLGALRYFKNRIPVLFRGESTLLDPLPAWRKAARRVFLRWVYSHVDIPIALGSNNRDYFRWCGIPDERIALAPYVIDTERFADAQGVHTRRAAELRHELGIAADTRVVVFAGKLQPKKDPMLLLEAFLSCGAPGELVFAGAGVLEEQLRARARGQTHVHFLPFQNQQAMPAVYRLGDVFVLPSRGPGETWGLAVNEAMACGRATIASDRVGGARDLLREGATGWIFEAGNREQLSAALRHALSCERRSLLEMGAAAQRESRRWSIAAAAAGIESAALGAIAQRA
jgi:glycosyltransferase involved in cell wall biosynthesis